MKNSNGLTMVLVLAMLPLYSINAAMDGEDIIKKLIAHYKDRHEGIYDMVTERGEDIIYEKWEKTDDGSVVYKMRNEQMVNGEKQVTIYDGEYYWFKDPQSGEVQRKEEKAFDQMAFFEYLKSQDLAYEGVKEVDGHDCHLLRIEEVDMEKIFNPSSGEAAVDPEAGSADAFQEAEVEAVFFIDEEDWVIRKMEYDIEDMEIERGDQTVERDVKMTIENSDFREIEGMLVAFESVSTTEFEMTEEEREQAKEMKNQMEKMEEQMEDMPESHELDKLIEELPSEVDEDERIRMYHEMQEIMTERAPVIISGFRENTYGIHKDVRGFTPHLELEAIDFTEFYFAE
ncbi:MAG: hypothetical protein R6U19_06095 [Bacteroidales bacterium]